MDLKCLVAVWVTEFSDQLSEQADRITNGPAQLERASSALDTRLINAEKRNDETIDRNTARILAIETRLLRHRLSRAILGPVRLVPRPLEPKVNDETWWTINVWLSPGSTLPRGAAWAYLLHRRRTATTAAQCVLASLVPCGRLVWPHGFAGLSLRTTILK